MSKLPVTSLSKIILENKSSKKFLLATVGSFAFSMTVILATIGLMDGFVFSLKQALSHSNGDIKFTAVEGFFNYDDKLKDQLAEISPGKNTSVLQLESFALVQEISKGVLLRGVDRKEFAQITGLPTMKLKEGVLVGKQFQKTFNLKLGDNIVLALATRKGKSSSSTLLKTFTIAGFVSHGIYEKEFRYIYIEKSILENLVGYKAGTANIGLVKLENFESLKSVSGELNAVFEDKLFFQPFWSEFKTLVDAVEIEKYSISLVLQLIVLVAILNIMAFVVYISEIKAQDFFMLRALGLSMKSYRQFWYVLLFALWAFSCLLSQGFLYVLNHGILKLPFLKIPGDIYVLSELQLRLESIDYIYVYGLSYLWILLIGFFTMMRQSKKTLINGLRQELG